MEVSRKLLKWYTYWRIDKPTNIVRLYLSSKNNNWGNALHAIFEHQEYLEVTLLFDVYLRMLKTINSREWRDAIYTVYVLANSRCLDFLPENENLQFQIEF